MPGKPVPSRIVLSLLALVLVLPIVISVIVALAALLGGMGDSAGAGALKYVALAAGIVWTVGLVCLVLVEGLNSLANTPDQDDSPAGRDENDQFPPVP
ncbi:MAG: hypothetical protein ABSG68_06395 [Thermoguttaceae bacterium]|jgi:hypothetical protein